MGNERYGHEYLTVRHGVWQYYRRVPAHFAHLDKRGTVKLSTKIKVAKDRDWHQGQPGRRADQQPPWKPTGAACPNRKPPTRCAPMTTR